MVETNGSGIISKVFMLCSRRLLETHKVTYSYHGRNLDDEGHGNPMVDACRESHGNHRVKLHYAHPIDEWVGILIEQW